VNAYKELALSADGRTLATVLTNVDSSISYYKPDSDAPVSTTTLRFTPTSITWASEQRLLSIARNVSFGVIDRVTGNLQPFDMGTIRIGGWLAACPDGHVLFTGVPKEAVEARLYLINSDGSDSAQLAAVGTVRSPFCTPDSQTAYFTVHDGSKSSIWTVPLAGGQARQVLPPDSFEAATFSSNGKLAVALRIEQDSYSLKITDLATGRQVASLPFDQSAIGGYPRFAPDGKAVMYAVGRQGGQTLLYQPLDGSASHPLIDPLDGNISEFAWSPSGKQLAVLREKSSSDVVLITDRSGQRSGIGDN